MKHLKLLVCALMVSLASCSSQHSKALDIDAYLNAATSPESIYPSEQQIAMLESIIPQDTYVPFAKATDRAYWDAIAASEHGQKYFSQAMQMLDKEPEVPISDEIYRRANAGGIRGIYKPRYYRTMDRLEHFIIAECMENKGTFLPQIEVYSNAIMDMKSWLHPNHDDKENGVLEGRRVAIDLGARKFGMVLALADVILENKLSDKLHTRITEQLQWRITDSYLKSCGQLKPESNPWIRATSNWNSVCTSGSLLAIISKCEDRGQRLAAIGSSINSMKYYLTGFGEDGYCSEGAGYWNYGFGHYLYLAEILYDYTNGAIDLFNFNNPEKMVNIANYPTNFEIQNGMYPPFADGVTGVSSKSDNFAYMMAAKHYGSRKPIKFIPDEAVFTVIGWRDAAENTDSLRVKEELPEVTYFDDFGVVISRGQQEKALSIAIKAGHNAENHNHSDVGSYLVVLGKNGVAGDIGAPSYIAGAFSAKNPARSSWGHPVPRINNTLQSNGIKRRGEITKTEFVEGKDFIEMNLLAAYEIPELETLTRTMTNDKSAAGSISITDSFTASEPVVFGTAVMLNNKYKIKDNKIFIKAGDQEVRVDISAEGAPIVIKDEIVPVKALRSGKTSYRIGIDFTEPLKSGNITVTYVPM